MPASRLWRSGLRRRPNVPILEVAEVRRGPRIAGDKDDGSDRYRRCEEPLGSDDGPDCIGAEVVIKVCKGATSVGSQGWLSLAIEYAKDVHLGCPLFSQPRKHVVESQHDRLLDAHTFGYFKTPALSIR
jgi:hypothetical protein